MSLAILFHFLRTQHVSDINISTIRSLRLCCWITTSVVLFCKDGGFNVSVNVWCLVVCVWCDVFCRSVVVGRRVFIDIDPYILNIRFTNAKQAKIAHEYKNIKRRLHKTTGNKIASDIKLVFYSSTITMMRGPINNRFLIVILKNCTSAHCIYYYTR